MRILLINGPNLNRLGRRDPNLYGHETLADIEKMVASRAAELGADIVTFQSNGEGDLIDFIQSAAEEADGIVINPGALTHYGYSLRDALTDTSLPVVEVHLSNVHARENFRRRSVIAPITRGQIVGLGAIGYVHALEYLVRQASSSERPQ
jgi:3-dehydroquinate dehydratase-2